MRRPLWVIPCITLLLSALLSPTWATPGAGCSAGGGLSPTGVYHPGESVSGNANGMGNPNSQHWGQGDASLSGDSAGQSISGLWPSSTGSADFTGSVESTAEGVGFVHWDCDLSSESHAWGGKTLEWGDIRAEPYSAAIYASADAAATDPDGTADPPIAEFFRASWITVQGWGPPPGGGGGGGAPAGGDEGLGFGDVIAPNERS
jgi:hypothetical protein